LLLTPRCTSIQVLGEKLGQSDLSRNGRAGTDRHRDVARARPRRPQCAPPEVARAFPRHSVHRGPLKSTHATWSLALAARPRTTLSASPSAGPSPVRARPPRLPPYHGRDAVVPFVTKQAAAAYSRTLRQPCVRHRPCLPELAAGRHSRRHRGACPSCPTPSLVPTEAHPTALSHGRASTSPEQALPRLASGDATEHHRRLLLRRQQPTEWNPR
jgi:hypothetical protein